MNGARAALADAAAVFRSSEFKQVAKDPEEGHSGVRFNGAILTINVKGILSHGIKGGNEEPLFRFNAQYNGNLTKTKASNALSCPKLTSENDGGRATRPTSLTHALGPERCAELLHEGFTIFRGRAVVFLAHFGESGTSLMIDHPFAGYPVAESHGAAGDGSGNENGVIDLQRDSTDGGGIGVRGSIFRSWCWCCGIGGRRWWLRRRGLRDVVGVGLGGLIDQGKIQVVDEKSHVHVGHGYLEIGVDAFLHIGERGPISDPGGDFGGLLRRQ